jgi:ACS family tartrate transporter-like MFS transporter
MIGLKAYMPAFWALPSLLLTEAAAAGSIGLINSVGNLGGFVGPTILGTIEDWTGSFIPGLTYLCISMLISATIILTLGIGHRSVTIDAAGRTQLETALDEQPDAVIEPA